MTHMKALLVDARWLVLGSANFDVWSDRSQQEYVLLVSEPRTIAEFHRRVVEPDLACSRPAPRPDTVRGSRGVETRLAGLAVLASLGARARPNCEGSTRGNRAVDLLGAQKHTGRRFRTSHHSFFSRGSMYTEVFVPVDNSQHSDWAVERAIELARLSKGRITANHVYAARLHDVRFRQLETGLPAQFQTPDEIKRQRKIHDKLIEKGLQLIADSFLDQVGNRCEKAGVDLTRQLLEGINYEEIVREVNRGEGRLPGLIGFDPNRAKGYDGGERGRGDVQLGEDGRIVAEDEDEAAKLVGTSGRQYDLMVIGAHGLGRQKYSQLGGVVARTLRGIEKDTLIVRDDKPLSGGRIMVCIDGILLLQGHALGARAGARRRDALRLQRLRRQYHHVCSTTSRTCLRCGPQSLSSRSRRSCTTTSSTGGLPAVKANLKR
jgi:nucleotide-binding universal stress UspA family protein